MTTVDPKVHDLARAFVDDIPAALQQPALRTIVTNRLAMAMQLAIEDELVAIQRDIEAGQRAADFIIRLERER